MWRSGRAASVLVPILLLSACGDLPQPFRGTPGATASRLAQPPAPRLAVASPPRSLLSDGAAEGWAEAVADALQAQELPAVPIRAARRGDWKLVLSADLRGDAVVPHYEVQDPAGAGKGTVDGAPVPARTWAEADPATLRQAAAAAAPGITTLLARIEAARRQADPNSLVNRPARLRLVGVTGAPGDGNRALADQLRAKLGTLGLVVQDTARDADFSVAGQVATEPGVNGTVRVEVQWIVLDAADKERGRILQLNEVPPASISRYWGDVAAVVASEAAGGVRDVILNAAGLRHIGPSAGDGPGSAAAPAAASSPAGAPASADASAAATTAASPPARPARGQ